MNFSQIWAKIISNLNEYRLIALLHCFFSFIWNRKIYIELGNRSCTGKSLLCSRCRRALRWVNVAWLIPPNLGRLTEARNSTSFLAVARTALWCISLPGQKRTRYSLKKIKKISSFLSSHDLKCSNSWEVPAGWSGPCLPAFVPQVALVRLFISTWMAFHTVAKNIYCFLFIYLFYNQPHETWPFSLSNWKAQLCGIKITHQPAGSLVWASR